MYVLNNDDSVVVASIPSIFHGTLDYKTGDKQKKVTYL